MEQLDKAVCNDEWLSYFSASKVVHLECGSFDYKPIIIHPLGIPQRRQKPWRFEQVWLVDEGCHATVNSTWNINLPRSYIVQVEVKIDSC